MYPLYALSHLHPFTPTITELLSMSMSSLFSFPSPPPPSHLNR